MTPTQLVLCLFEVENWNFLLSIVNVTTEVTEETSPNVPLIPISQELLYNSSINENTKSDRLHSEKIKGVWTTEWAWNKCQDVVYVNSKSW